MRGTGAEQPVVAVKRLKGRWSKGAASSSREHGSTRKGRSSMSSSKGLRDIRRRWCGMPTWTSKRSGGGPGVDGQTMEEFERI